MAKVDPALVQIQALMGGGIGSGANSGGLRKAAILMIALGEELSSKIMANLDDEEVSDLP